MLTKAELDAIWEAPYGAFERWKQRNKAALALSKKEKNYKKYKVTITVLKKELIKEFEYEIRAPNYNTAQLRTGDFFDQVKKEVGIERYDSRYILSPRVTECK